ncbi:MAG: VWA domain-containing protein [Anaerolineae bacterium]|nr:VWA domain-containing protein [Anaerolineae bacterium]
MRQRLIILIVIGLSFSLLTLTTTLLAAPTGINLQLTQVDVRTVSTSRESEVDLISYSRASRAPVTPTSYTAPIHPGTEMLMGNTNLKLAFAPGATGTITATLWPARPVAPPITGVFSPYWILSTTATNYEVTATFDYRRTTQVTEADIVLVVDKSGSMEMDTLCYGCWTPEEGVDYPDGNFWPLPWGGGPDGDPAPTLCEGNAPYEYSGRQYIVIEAEEYSYLSNPYSRDILTRGYTVWVLGRNGTPSPTYIGNAQAYGRDGRGAYLAYTPGRSYYYDGYGGGISCTWEDITTPDPVLGRVCNRDQAVIDMGGPFPAPRVDYDFTVPDTVTATWYIWVRGQGGDIDDYVFWGLDDEVLSEANGFGYRSGEYTNGADSSKWRWVRLPGTASLILSPGSQHTLHFWGGAPGFDIDRIIITNNSSTSLATTVLKTSHIDNNRTRWACDPCDARFAGYPGGTGYEAPPNCTDHPQPYRYQDDIYDDEQPMRGTVEAAKAFVRQFSPDCDQIGYVSYSTEATIHSELLCQAWAETQSISCTGETLTNILIPQLEATHADGGTNLADAIQEALTLFDTGPTHYSRPGAAHTILLLTDGSPNYYSDLGEAIPACYSTDYWPYNTGSSSNDKAADCTVYFAHQAQERGIVINTLTMGYAANTQLMRYIAELTGGQHHHVPNAQELKFNVDDFNIHLKPTQTASSGVIYHRVTPTAPWQMHPLTLTEAGPFYIRGKSITELGGEWVLGPMPIQLEVTPPALYADGIMTATITATVLSNDQLITDGTRVTFTASQGAFVPNAGTTVSGIVTTTFTAGLRPGTAILTATTGAMTGVLKLPLAALIPPTLTLTAVPATLPADAHATVLLTAVITDAYNHPIADKTPVTFTSSLGTISTPVKFTHNGTATAALIAGFDIGPAIITATTGFITHTTRVTFTLPAPYSLQLHAAPRVVHANGMAILTATVNDAYSQPLHYARIVTFATSLGNIIPLTCSTIHGIATTTLTTDLETGTANTASTAALTVNSSVVFIPLPPHKLTLTARPSHLPADAHATATLTATLTDVYNRPIQTSTYITFTTSLGTITPFTQFLQQGIATATLIPSSKTGTAHVTASANGLTDTIPVLFTPSPPKYIRLYVVPKAIPADGNATALLIASVTDAHLQLLNYDVPITFTPSSGTVLPPTRITHNSAATSTFIAGHKIGTVFITATVADTSISTPITLLPPTPHHIQLEVAPPRLPANANTPAIITATLTDAYNQTLQFSTFITFSTSLGTLTPTTRATVNSIATTTLIAGKTPGTAYITATAHNLQAYTHVTFYSTLYLPLILRK